MNKKQIMNILEQAKIRFLENDLYLFSVVANERSLTHKFAEYLQIAIGCSWNVDCEYNRYGNDSKKIHEIKKLIDPRGDNISIDDTEAKTVYPDIIVHKRGLNGSNLLVIEAKKDASDEKSRGDKEKLKKIQVEYRYSFAVFINFKTENKEIEWLFCDKK